MTGETPAAGGEAAPASIVTGAAPAAPAPNPAATPVTGSVATAAGATPEEPAATGGEAAKGAPEKYDDFKLPEGVVLNEKAMAEFLPLAKGLNLTQESAQQLVDLQVRMVQEAQQAQDQAWEQTLGGWKSAVVADKEIGGANLQGTIAACGKAIETFGSPTLKQTLEITGVGNHPDIVRFFAAVGKAISEDKLNIGNANGPAEVDLAHRLFPNMK